MKGLSLVGLLVAMGLVGYLVVRSLNSSTVTSPDGEGAPGQEAIDRANEAVDQIQEAGEQRQLPDDLPE